MLIFITKTSLSTLKAPVLFVSDRQQNVHETSRGRHLILQI